MLDPLAQPERLPGVPRRLERIERLAVRAVADRVDGDRPAGGRAARISSASSSPLVMHDAAPVEHPRGLRPERPVHERLQVAEPQVVVADPRAQPELRELGRPGRRQRLPHPQRSARPPRGCRPKIAGAPSQPSLSWIAPTPRAFASLSPSRVAATHSSSETVTCRLAEAATRTPRAGRPSARLARRARRRRRAPRGRRPRARARRC